MKEEMKKRDDPDRIEFNPPPEPRLTYGAFAPGHGSDFSDTQFSVPDLFTSEDPDAYMERKPTLIGDIEVNDGRLTLAIVNTELKKDPKKLVGGDYTSYHIKGRDSLGEIDIERRYSEFLLFREKLFGRYPGLFIPPVPGK